MIMQGINATVQAKQCYFQPAEGIPQDSGTVITKCFPAVYTIMSPWTLYGCLSQYFTT